MYTLGEVFRRQYKKTMPKLPSKTKMRRNSSFIGKELAFEDVNCSSGITYTVQMTRATHTIVIKCTNEILTSPTKGVEFCIEISSELKIDEVATLLVYTIKLYETDFYHVFKRDARVSNKRGVYPRVQIKPYLMISKKYN